MDKILSYPMPAKYPHNPIIYRTSKDQEMNRLLIVGMMATPSKDSIVTNIQLSGERIIKTKLRKSSGKNGKLKICKLSNFELNQVRSVLESLLSALPNKVDTNNTILVTGFSIRDTELRDVFMEGTLVRLCHPHLMEIIGSSLEATHEVTLHYDLINNEGKV